MIDVKAPYYKRKIKCPAHYLIDPKEDIYLREEVPELRGVSKSAVITYGVKKTRIKLDRYGQKMIDWKKMYEMKKRGKVLQPFISASEAIERAYDPLSPVCRKCQRRCFKGKQNINETRIKRLHG